MSFLTAHLDFSGNDWLLVKKEVHSKSPDDSQLQQVDECEIKRYGAYFKGWCQSFGEHECIPVERNDGFWLLSENQVGLVLPKPMIRTLYREVLLHDQVSPLTFCQRGVQIGSLRFPFRSEREKKVFGAIERLIKSGPNLHVFLSSHLLYGSGGRIITFSCKRPLSIIYKEIGNMQTRLSHSDGWLVDSQAGDGV